MRDCGLDSLAQRPDDPLAAIDVAVLSAWMDDHRIGHGAIENLEPIEGGSQNIVLRFRRAGSAYVLRHPPRHKRAESDEMMRREVRLLSALEATDVPHPRIIAAEGDPSVMGSAFYLMEAVEGFNPSRSLPRPYRSDARLQRDIGLAMAEAIGALARVDFAAIGLQSFGRPQGWLDRQVERWRRQLLSYESYEGYTAGGLPGHADVGRWLEERVPGDWQPGIIHGDFSLANVLMHGSRGEVTAIVDWELATLGDPLLDLGHLLATWPASAGGGPFPCVKAPNLSSTQEIADRYAEVTGRSLDYLGWYRVLACFRLASILEGTYARSCSGAASRDVGVRLHGVAIDLLEQATGLIAAG